MRLPLSRWMSAPGWPTRLAAVAASWWIVAVGCVMSPTTAVQVHVLPAPPQDRAAEAGRSKVHEIAELAAPDGAEGDEFGSSVAISSDRSTAVVGAPIHDTTVGAAYVFVHRGKTWNQIGELAATDGVAGDYFGDFVAVSSDGDTVVVGAEGHNGFAGAAYVFARQHKAWSQTGELVASDGGADEYFGDSVAVSSDGSTVVVGADGHNGLTGSAYVFSLDSETWTQTAELAASDGATNDYFGTSVALADDGSTALVGAIGNADFTGAAYVFTNTGETWEQVAEIAPSDGAANDDFGNSVAISSDGSSAVVGAPDHSDAGGDAYVFASTGGTWEQTAELAASDGVSGDEFGFSVSLSSDGLTAVVGAASHNKDSGAAYVFGSGGATWNQTAEISARHGKFFANSVSTSSDGSMIVVGAVGLHHVAGAAFVFRN